MSERFRFEKNPRNRNLQEVARIEFYLFSVMNWNACG